MQRMAAIAVVLGALIVAVSLIYHGRQLASVAKQMQALEQRTGELDNRLEKFSKELPSLIEQAGKDAGRQAVHGAIEEAFQKPLSRVASTLAHTTSNITKRADGPFEVNRLFPDGGIPLIRFDIPDPVVNIDIFTDIEDLPSLPWLSHTNNEQSVAMTNHNVRSTDKESGPEVRR